MYNPYLKMMKDRSQVKQNHSWHFEKSFSSSKKYEQFINWLRIEFHSFQQDQDPFLTIYFPNGEVKVISEEKADTALISKITVESKCGKVGLKMKKILSDFLNHIEHYNQFSHKPILN